MTDRSGSASEIVCQVDQRIKHQNGIQHPWSAADFVIPTENENSLLISEREGEADLAICLRKDLLKSLELRKFPEDFSFSILPDLSILVEELSHFNFYCVHAHHGRKISGLEMEVQAEVDKFAFALDCLREQNALDLRHQLFETLFGELRLGEWVAEQDRARYEEAHRIARAFCRRLLRAHEHHQELLKDFFKQSPEERLSSR